MDEHVHLWVHRRTLGRNVIERCAHCRRARMPKLSAAEASATDMALMSATFKEVYGRRISDMVPASTCALLTRWTHA